MSTDVLALDAALLRSIPDPRRVYKTPLSAFPTLTSKIDLLSEIVERNWSDLPDSLKSLAKAYVYFYLEEDQHPSFLDRLRFAWFMFRNMTEKDEITKLQTAIIRLSDAVFTVVERDTPQYQRDLANALSEDQGLTLTTTENLREWMHKL